MNYVNYNLDCLVTSYNGNGAKIFGKSFESPPLKFYYRCPSEFSTTTCGDRLVYVIVPNEKCYGTDLNFRSAHVFIWYIPARLIPGSVRNWQDNVAFEHPSTPECVSLRRTLDNFALLMTRIVWIKTIDERHHNASQLNRKLLCVLNEYSVVSRFSLICWISKIAQLESSKGRK